MSDGRELEICAESLQACEAARLGGADRIELCSALETGGVTPSHGLIGAACRDGGLPVHVLVRPRAGNFVYTEAEFRAMCADVEHALGMGAAGIVTGVLEEDGRVDCDRLRALVRLAAGKPVTFHRAIDLSRDLLGALDDAMEAGCARVLTSGGEPSALRGREQIKTMVQAGAGRIRIAAGGGVTAETAVELMRVRGLDLHASLRGAVREREAKLDPLWRSSMEGWVRVDDVRMLADIVHGDGRA